MAKAVSATSLQPATGNRLDDILAETWAIWSEGLPLDRYRRWQLDQAATTWGRASLCRLALVRDHVWLSSAKRYRFTARIAGESANVVGIGAVFTPPAQRGAGHARVLIERMLQEASAEGAAVALLFSEIGAAYYEALGFRVVPTTAVTLDVPRGASTTASIRPGTSADLDAIAHLGQRDATRADFAIDRSADLIAFGMTRRRRLVELGAPAMQAFDWIVSERGDRVTASLITSRARSGVVVECCVDEDPECRDLVALLSAATAAVHGEDGRVRACWPAWLRPSDVRVISEEPVHEVMMIRPLGASGMAGPRPSRPLAWPLDVF